MYASGARVIATHVDHAKVTHEATHVDTYSLLFEATLNKKCSKTFK